MKTTDEIFYGKAIADEYDRTQSIMQLGWMDWDPHAPGTAIVQCLEENRINHQHILKDKDNFIILMDIDLPIYNNVSIIIELTGHEGNYAANLVSLEIGASYEWRWMKGRHKSHSADSRRALINIVAKGIHIIEDFLVQSREIGRHLDIARQPV